jgi:probable rRNA maturation factor
MIETEILVEGWPAETDWTALTALTVTTAIAATPHKALITSHQRIEVSIKFTDNAEVQALNLNYRGKDTPTNVLSFPMIAPDLIAAIANMDEGEILLGDIVLAFETCAREAGERGIAIAAHATHLIVHGTLHLLGYDHNMDEEAETMEALEQMIMASLGLHNPYEAIED